MRQLLIRLGLWIAKLGGYVESTYTKPECSSWHLEIPDVLLGTAKLLVAQVEDKFQGVSGEFKRAQALRAVMNSHPEYSERQCSQAIELAVHHIL